MVNKTNSAQNSMMLSTSKICAFKVLKTTITTHHEIGHHKESEVKRSFAAVAEEHDGLKARLNTLQDTVSQQGDWSYQPIPLAEM